MKARIPDKPRQAINAKTKMVACDKGCGKEFELNVQEEDLGDIAHFGKTTRKYMECTHCHEQYNIGFVNETVSALLSANQEMMNEPELYDPKQIKRNKNKGIRIMNRIESAWRRMQ